MENSLNLNTDYVVEGLSQSDMEWADLDDDSDQDLIITGIDDNNQNQAYYYTNLGNFNFFKEELFRNFLKEFKEEKLI